MVAISTLIHPLSELGLESYRSSEVGVGVEEEMICMKPYH